MKTKAEIANEIESMIEKFEDLTKNDHYQYEMSYGRATGVLKDIGELVMSNSDIVLDSLKD